MSYERFQTLVSAIQVALDNGEEAALSPARTSPINLAHQSFVLALNMEVSDVGQSPH